MIKRSIMIMVIIVFSFVSLYKFFDQFSLEMKDENDPATSDKKKPTGRKGKAGGASKKTSENDDPANEDLNLSEGEDSADDKQVKKGPTKRSAPSSDKKSGTTNS